MDVVTQFEADALAAGRTIRTHFVDIKMMVPTKARALLSAVATAAKEKDPRSFHKVIGVN